MIEARWAEYRLFDYERHLGRRELHALTGVQPNEERQGLLLPTESMPHQKMLIDLLAERTTYFQEISGGGQTMTTLQSETESAHWRLRGATRRRQATRFGVHGVHEYRGKFNPQMARALVNVVDHSADVLLDPFCGSGTTLLEGLRLGLTVVGVDRSPLAQHLASVKVAALRHPDPRDLATEFTEISRAVAEVLKCTQDKGTAESPGHLTSDATTYLAAWFTQPALAALFAALNYLRPQHASIAGQLAGLALSSILRKVSLQAPEDLRIRRRPPGFVAPSLADHFLAAAERIALGLEELTGMPPPTQAAHVALGSADDPKLLEHEVPAGRRLIVTSPPYATALPYIDTDRLSLIALDLAAPKQTHSLEATLLGSREWNRSDTAYWNHARQANSADLPAQLLDLLIEIENRNQRLGAGFRRAAVPSLLYRYFTKMGDCFTAWSTLLASGERAVLVVGRNRTGPAHARVTIDTPRLLGEVAETRGFRVDELIPFETWPRYGLHSSNGVRGEDALVISRK